MKTWGLRALISASLLWGCAGDDEPNSNPPPELDFTEFDQMVASYVADQGLEGATAIVVHRDWGVMHESGYGSFEADRISLIASSSKMVTAGVLMRLHDQGLIDINGPVGEYLSSWGEGKPELTVAQMLSNSSGLIGLLNNPLYAPYGCQYLPSGTLTQCATAIYTADDSADRVEPDSEFRYGGGQWQLAGGVAEQVTGKTWSELFEETYVEPCGLMSSGYTNHFSLSALNYPASFDGDITDLPVTNNPSMEGGMYTSVQDYGELLLMHLRGGVCGKKRVLEAESVDFMQADRIGEVYDGTTNDTVNFPGYGLGWWVSRNQPGLVQDSGAYGAVPWIDNERGYAAFIIFEAGAGTGPSLALQVRPVLEALFDSVEP